MQPKAKKRLLITLIVLFLLLLVPAWFAYQLGVIPRLDRSDLSCTGLRTGRARDLLSDP